jgi:hypothetical protein
MKTANDYKNETLKIIYDYNKKEIDEIYKRIDDFSKLGSFKANCQYFHINPIVVIYFENLGFKIENNKESKLLIIEW